MKNLLITIFLTVLGCSVQTIDLPKPEVEVKLISAKKEDGSVEQEYFHLILKWKKFNKKTFYNIERSAAENGAFQEVAVLKDRSCYSEKIVVGRRWWYRVVAKHESKIEYSLPVCVEAMPRIEIKSLEVKRGTTGCFKVKAKRVLYKTLKYYIGEEEVKAEEIEKGIICNGGEKIKITAISAHGLKIESNEITLPSNDIGIDLKEENLKSIESEEVKKCILGCIENYKNLDDISKRDKALVNLIATLIKSLEENCKEESKDIVNFLKKLEIPKRVRGAIEKRIKIISKSLIKVLEHLKCNENEIEIRDKILKELNASSMET